jgi:predicted unusual protein kinase regulating ubiquinone biosynthesis (AarF/ABC1/UbiB family)
MRAGVRSSVSIPRPVPGLVSCNVLVEAYEPGDSVAQFMRQPAPINTHIVALGVDAFLKMLLIDNFVHTDLHPGACWGGCHGGSMQRGARAAPAARSVSVERL